MYMTHAWAECRFFYSRRLMDGKGGLNGSLFALFGKKFR